MISMLKKSINKESLDTWRAFQTIAVNYMNLKPVAFPIRFQKTLKVSFTLLWVRTQQAAKHPQVIIKFQAKKR